ncbi:16S rRNA (cytosine(1402)-N(4))-methyltransferase [Candidatus Falkowbacteria bacterium]|nr:MAG: 16S rRNA (cytosine(1402)-N(4))-methyltransferase [Candidatus Falkowbacteria bacterium]
MEYRHTPVMLREVIEYLDPGPNENFIDCTLGGGGYTFEILKKIKPNGKILAIDLDKLAHEHGKIKYNKNKNLILVNDNFKNLSKIIKDIWPKKEIPGFSGIVFDLGLSQAQLEDRKRGFSFKLDAPLDMAFGQQVLDNRPPFVKATEGKYQTTEYLVNKFKRDKLEKILRQYGEERYARNIVDKIIRERKIKTIKTTGELVEIISKAVPPQYKNKKIHFATRTFQALRIATNNELYNLEEALPQALDLLKKGGRVVVVSYHSLEDRIVKNYFKKESRDCVCPPLAPACVCGHKAGLKIITKKIITPTSREIDFNPKSRSAKMRVVEKI